MSNTQPVTSATEAITYGLQDAYNVYKKTSLQMLWAWYGPAWQQLSL